MYYWGSVFSSDRVKEGMSFVKLSAFVVNIV